MLGVVLEGAEGTSGDVVGFRGVLSVSGPTGVSSEVGKGGDTDTECMGGVVTVTAWVSAGPSLSSPSKDGMW